MQGKYKTKKCSKGIKKIKKYEDGTDSVTPETSTATGAVLGQIGGTVGGLGAMGIEALTKSKYDGRYTSQLKDENQAVGRAIGAGAGQALNLVVPGLGSLAAPILSSAGGAIQRGFQGDKLKQLKKEDEYNQRVGKANENVITDLTSFQAKQYSKGTKVIEIEGKKTPEIHTDKNFNLKNLGTTPHSKGGNKVVAEEGDVVFPTQNSPKKYNEIMNAIMKKDKYKLKKEQSKLPEDKASKYPTGTKKIVDTTEVPELVSNKGIGKTSVKYKGKTYKGLGNKLDQKKNYTPEYVKEAWAAKNRGEVDIVDDGAYPTPYFRYKGGAAIAVNQREEEEAPAQPTLSQAQIDGRAAEDSYKFPTKSATTPTAADNQKKGFKFDANNLMELAPIAYNLGQGLFGNVEKVKRKEYNPQLEQYVDTSNNMRREVNQNYKMAQSDARNFSSGLASNVRANSQAAANQKLSQMNQIDSQEYGKQLDVNNRNVDRINDGKKINIDLFNNYEDLDAQNRAVKQNALSTGLEQMSELGSRNKLQKNLLSNQKYSANLLAGGNYDTPINDEGQAEEGVLFKGAKTNPINSSSLGMFAPKKPKKGSKGFKSIQVERRYKLK